jgi:hypothetical protein
MPEFCSQISGTRLDVEACMLKFAAHPRRPDPVRIEAGASHEFRLSLLAARTCKGMRTGRLATSTASKHPVRRNESVAAITKPFIRKKCSRNPAGSAPSKPSDGRYFFPMQSGPRDFKT